MYSVIIPWAGRAELKFTLQWNQRRFFEHGVEVIVVNAGGKWSELVDLLRSLPALDIRAVNLPGATFNRSLCANVGTLSSRGDLLFFLDADILLISDLFTAAAAHLNSSSAFVAVAQVLESQPGTDATSRAQDSPAPNWAFLAEHIRTVEMTTKDGRRAVLRRRTRPGVTHPGDGLVLVRKDHVSGVGGLNSRLRGWGYEDTDFQIRLQFLLGLERVDIGEVVHLTHRGSARDYRTWRRNMCETTDNYSLGNYMGTLEADGEEWKDHLAEATRED